MSLCIRLEWPGSPSQAEVGDRAALEAGDSLTFWCFLLTVGKFMDKVIPTSSACMDTRSAVLKDKENSSMKTYKLRLGMFHLQVVSYI